METSDDAHPERCSAATSLLLESLQIDPQTVDPKLVLRNAIGEQQLLEIVGRAKTEGHCLEHALTVAQERPEVGMKPPRVPQQRNVVPMKRHDER